MIILFILFVYEYLIGRVVFKYFIDNYQILSIKSYFIHHDLDGNAFLCFIYQDFLCHSLRLDHLLIFEQFVNLFI